MKVWKNCKIRTEKCTKPNYQMSNVECGPLFFIYFSFCILYEQKDYTDTRILVFIRAGRNGLPAWRIRDLNDVVKRHYHFGNLLRRCGRFPSK